LQLANYVDPAFPDRPLVLHAARPRDYDVGTPVLFVHHCVGRNGRDYPDYWLNLVDHADILAISIEFPEASVPEYLWYRFGNLHDKDGAPNRREEWTFGIDESLFDQLRAQGVTTQQHYGLLGSAGGQFVHRMVSFGFRKSRRCRRQRQCRHLREAGSGNALAVWRRREAVDAMHCARCSAAASR
jgi:hypothetical protein